MKAFKVSSLLAEPPLLALDTYGEFVDQSTSQYRNSQDTGTDIFPLWFSGTVNKTSFFSGRKHQKPWCDSILPLSRYLHHVAHCQGSPALTSDVSQGQNNHTSSTGQVSSSPTLFGTITVLGRNTSHLGGSRTLPVEEQEVRWDYNCQS